MNSQLNEHALNIIGTDALSETQFQRMVRKARAGKLGVGSVHLSAYGYSFDGFFKSKKGLIKQLNTFLENVDTYWDFIKHMKNHPYKCNCTLCSSDERS